MSIKHLLETEGIYTIHQLAANPVRGKKLYLRATLHAEGSDIDYVVSDDNTIRLVTKHVMLAAETYDNL